MGIDWSTLTNEEILVKLKELEITHINKKNFMLGLLDELEEIEENFTKGNKEIIKRKTGI